MKRLQMSFILEHDVNLPAGTYANLLMDGASGRGSVEPALVFGSPAPEPKPELARLPRPAKNRAQVYKRGDWWMCRKYDDRGVTHTSHFFLWRDAMDFAYGDTRIVSLRFPW